MQVTFNMDPKQWQRATSEYERIITKAETLAIHDVGILARDGGRESIAAAGFSKRWQNSLQVRFTPKSGYSFSPQANIHTTINFADVFETGKTIRGGPYLWLPLPNVPPIAGRPHMTPAQYVANIGPLVSMERPGKLPLLGAQVKTSFTGAFVRGRTPSRSVLKRGLASSRGVSQTVPMFFAVPVVDIPKKWNVHAAIVEASKKLQERYIANLETYK
jgi:hypothetical protein